MQEGLHRPVVDTGSGVIPTALSKLKALLCYVEASARGVTRNLPDIQNICS